MNLPFLALGAVGAVSVAAHWVGPELSEVISLFFSGEVEAAALLNRELVRYVSFQSGDDAPNPLPAKAVMRALGLKVGECRLPHGRAPEWLDQAAAELLSDLATFRQARPTNRLSA